MTRFYRSKSYAGNYPYLERFLTFFYSAINVRFLPAVRKTLDLHVGFCLCLAVCGEECQTGGGWWGVFPCKCCKVG